MMSEPRPKFTDADYDREINLIDKIIQRPWMIDLGLLDALIEHYSVEPMVTRSSGERRDLYEALCDYLEEVRDVRRKDIKESWLSRQSKRLKDTLRKLDLDE